MITFKVNADKFAKEIDAELAKMYEMLDGVMRGISVEAFGILIHETPQWTGNAAANWNFGIGAPDFSVDLIFKQKQTESDAPVHLAASMEAKQKGGLEAVQYAIQRNAGKELGVTFNTKVFLSNNASNLSGESYIHMLESNPNNFLRAENDPGHMATRAVEAIESKYGNISKADAVKLSAKTIEGLAGASAQLELFS